ncbi:MAG: hypothetical protein AAB922_04830 [Patescibacteria group bacterium]
MKSLLKILSSNGMDKKHPVTKKLVKVSKGYQSEGHSVSEADKHALQDLMDETMAEKEGYISQIKGV